MSANKSLFNAKDLGPLSSYNGVLASKSNANQEDWIKATFNGKAGKFIKELDWMLDRKKDQIDFVTAGNLSLHQIIEFLLTKYGPCMELFISTWAIKEAGARSLFKCFEKGLIGSLHGVFDYRIETVDSNAFQLIRKIFYEYALTKNHAKVVLLEYKDFYITILTSANLSNNPRIETGFVSLSKSTFYFHKGWMMDALKGKKVY
jgi:hypothetical protein